MKNTIIFIALLGTLFFSLSFTAIADDFAGGSGTENDPFLVETAEHLDNVRNHLDAHFKQIEDIDLSGYAEGEGWDPIGVFIDDDHEDNDPFTGTYDGDGYTIYNLTIDRPNLNRVGLISFAVGARLRNIALENIEVTGNHRVGGLVGTSEQSSTIHRCYATGTVTGGNGVGGLVGYLGRSSWVQRSYATGTVTGHDSVGGLVGSNWGYIHSSNAGVKVTGNENVGGLAGYCNHASNSHTVNSYATGAVTGVRHVGGLVGRLVSGFDFGDGFNARKITNCYATGDVTSTGSISYVGGLVGSVWEGYIDNSYATGAVTGNYGVGGLVGSITRGGISRCYAAGAVTGGSSVGGMWGKIYVCEHHIIPHLWANYVDYETTGRYASDDMHKTTAEMMQEETFYTWDFEETWGIIENETYPFLRWEEVGYLNAAFSADPTEGLEPLEVTFTDRSIGDIDTWHWDFGDGNSSNEQNPVHTYAQANIYTVTLTVTGSDRTDSATKDITVYAVRSSFSAHPTAGIAPLQVTFIDTSLGDIDAWHWDFGDGNSSNEQHTEHEYTQPGVYTVTLTVSNDGRESSSMIDISAYYQFSGGNGTEDDPLLIATSEDFNMIRYCLNAHFKQIADIDLSDYAEGKGWEPIGEYDRHPFLGSYDGNGYTITNLFIDRTDTNHIGLFAFTGENAYLKNVALEDIEISGKEYVGGLVGRNDGSLIENCYVTGTVTGWIRIGGLIGWQEDGRIEKSYSSALVTGSGWVLGGLVAVNKGSIENCYATGAVTGQGQSYVAGLVAENEGTIKNCYAAGAVTCSPFGFYNGGLVGQNFRDGTITSSYFDKETVGQWGVEGRTTEEMRQKATFEGWDFEEVWGIIEDETYPFLKWEITDEEYNAKVEAHSIPSLYKNRHANISLTFRNTGTQTWEKDSLIRLGAVGNEDDLASPENYRIGLEHDVEPDQLYTFTIPVYPEETGTFTIEWQMIKEGEFWFGEVFSQEVEVIERTKIEETIWQMYK